MPLEVSIVTGSAAPIYRQITDQICRALVTGKLVPGEQMPSVRVLAEELVLNPNTIGRAYAELIREGVLEGQQGKGVFVAARRRPIYTRSERLRRIQDSLETFVGQGVYLGFSPDELRELLETRLAPLEKAITKRSGAHE